jgi:predicted nucleotide-binding protein
MNERDVQQYQVESVDRRRVFVIHGRNLQARDAMFAFLRAIDLDPIEWEEAIEMTSEATPYVGHVLDVAFSRAQAAVVLLTGDDLARLGGRYVKTSDQDHDKRLTPQARPNVIFETGMAYGKYPERTIMVEIGNSRPFSDTVGRNTIRFLDNAVSRKKIADRLKNASCAVRTDNRSDWLTAGDFSLAFEAPDLIGVEEQAGLTVIRRESSPEGNATYKPKVWIEIRNDSSACITIRHLGWLEIPDGIRMKYAPRSMQLKIGKFWCPESDGVDHLVVPFRETIRLWVQPTEQYEMNDLKSRCGLTGKIGNLLLRVDDNEVQLPV